MGSVQSLWDGIRDAEQMSFQMGPEDSYGRCGGYTFMQTITDKQR